ncbi:MAG TPA: TerC family protein [Rhodothermales bacterium]
MTVPFGYWVAFNAGVIVLLAVDLGLFNRKAHDVNFREAGLWSAFCVSLALALNYAIWQTFGPRAGTEFLAGYLVELSLSVDNLFVFAVIFGYFGVPAQYQHRVLFWGILGAIVMRALMIFLGVALLNRFHWLLPVFGAFLIYTGIRMLRQHSAEETVEEESRIASFVRRYLPVTLAYHGKRFLVRDGGRLMITPLMLVLIMIELTDVVFALDSIPAILGITRDPFIVYSSNIMAIIGLRAMYFVLAGILTRFQYLHVGLSLVLTFIGAKMILELFEVHVPIVVSLLVIACVLVGSAVLSLVVTRRNSREEV